VNSIDLEASLFHPGLAPGVQSNGPGRVPGVRSGAPERSPGSAPESPGVAPGQPESGTSSAARSSQEQDDDSIAAAGAPGRVALGVAYRGQNYHGWQSQADGNTVQDALEKALAAFIGLPRGEIVTTMCAGRTDAGVHALNQVVHFDAPVSREEFSWVRGTNRYLPEDIAVQWAQYVDPDFHARNGARGRKYAFLVRESAVRPALEAGLCGWVFRPLDLATMRDAAKALIGEHDFSSFRSSQCQALSPVKHMRRIDIARIGDYWRFDFEANAFLHHMVRNLMGALITIGTGAQPASYMADLLAERDRALAPPTFPAAGLYFLGPQYDPHLAIPQRTSAHDWLPRVPPELARPDEASPFVSGPAPRP
jgi:tRNA pseudouridine38-40 synthase